MRVGRNPTDKESARLTAQRHYSLWPSRDDLPEVDAYGNVEDFLHRDMFGEDRAFPSDFDKRATFMRVGKRTQSKFGGEEEEGEDGEEDKRATFLRVGKNAAPFNGEN